ncbi:MAG: MFS transporter [Chitinophagaceae bacterium]
MAVELNNKKNIRAWTFYDWANSAYSLIITSAIFPAYYTAIVDERIPFFGISLNRNALASFSISFSFFLIALLSPILSSIADSQGNKKSFMKFFSYLGALACMAMFFFQKNETSNTVNVYFGITCSIIASVGYCGSLVFYNAFLPEIASKDQQDTISAKGFAMGYIGSVLLMIVCFAFILLNDSQGWHLGALPVRLSFVAVGLWWIGFAQIPFSTLPETKRDNKECLIQVCKNGYQELILVWQEVKQLPLLKKYLLSFFFYNLGVQTVMYMATFFASAEIKMQSSELMTVVLIIQLVAIAGAYFFSFISSKFGNLYALMILVAIWIVICISAFYVHTVHAFYLLAFCVGMIMGIQSLGRSSYSN